MYILLFECGCKIFIIFCGFRFDISNREPNSRIFFFYLDVFKYHFCLLSTWYHLDILCFQDFFPSIINPGRTCSSFRLPKYKGWIKTLRRYILELHSFIFWRTHSIHFPYVCWRFPPSIIIRVILISFTKKSR